MLLVMSEKVWPDPRSWIFTPMLSSKSYSLAVTFKSVFHEWLVFADHVSMFNFSPLIFICFSFSGWKDYHFFMKLWSNLYHNKFTISILLCFGLPLLFHWFTSLSFPNTTESYLLWFYTNPWKIYTFVLILTIVGFHISM